MGCFWLNALVTINPDQLRLLIVELSGFPLKDSLRNERNNSVNNNKTSQIANSRMKRFLILLVACRIIISLSPKKLFSSKP